MEKKKTRKNFRLDVLSVKKDLLEVNIEYLNRDLKVANKKRC